MFLGGSYKIRAVSSDVTISIIALTGGTSEHLFSAFATTVLISVDFIGFIVVFSIRRRLFLGISQMVNYFSSFWKIFTRFVYDFFKVAFSRFVYVCH